MPHKGPWCTFCLLHIAPHLWFLLICIQLNGWPKSKLSTVTPNEKCFCLQENIDPDAGHEHRTGRRRKWKEGGFSLSLILLDLYARVMRCFIALYVRRERWCPTYGGHARSRVKPMRRVFLSCWL
nr:uncharacterized protein LOC120364747 [Saimiri boliviensis boliviensis]